MEDRYICPECGAVLPAGKTCIEDFHQMLAWETEDQRLGVVHHLMVPSYYIQHPSLYSPEGLRWAHRLLANFAEQDLSPEEARRRQRDQVDSSQRDWKIKGTPESHGSYDPPIAWTMHASDVTARGMAHYITQVRTWAKSICDTLRAAGYLDA
ncbi:MAG: DUF5946 family protein [Anaerolineae bacterium]|nr:DUF5946 family protein [Anaerolineae bacterium]